MKRTRVSLLLVAALALFAAAPALCVCPPEAGCCAGCAPAAHSGDDPGCASCLRADPALGFATDAPQFAEPLPASFPCFAACAAAPPAAPRGPVPGFAHGRGSPSPAPPLRI